MLKQSIKTITLKKLLFGAIVVILALVLMIALNFRELTISAMEDKGQTVANFIKVGLTTHMKVSTHEAKELYKENLKRVSDVHNLNIVRSNIVNEKFGLEANDKLLNDPVIKKVFKEKKAEYILNDETKLLQVIFPYVANNTCVVCHDNAHIGDTLGAVNFYIDVSTYRHATDNYLYILLGALAIVLIGLIVLIYRIIERYIKNPLDMLVEDTRHSFEEHSSINLDDFESLELADVASKVNLFNQEVIRKNEELEEKNRLLTDLNNEIEDTQKEIVDTLGNIAESRSKETAYHVQRVAEYSYLLAKYYGLPEDECELLKKASPMHDIGKIGIADNILKKPAKLTDEEFDIMKEHANIGYEIFSKTERQILKTARIVAHEHHEKYNGEGYPRGIKGEDIHIYGRITALADVFDALGSNRVYKKAWEDEKIFELFKEEKGKHFDPKLVDIFFENLEEFLKIRDSLKD